MNIVVRQHPRGGEVALGAKPAHARCHGGDIRFTRAGTQQFCDAGLREDFAAACHLLLATAPDLLALLRRGLAVTLRGVRQHQMQHTIRIFRRKGAGNQCPE